MSKYNKVITKALGKTKTIANSFVSPLSVTPPTAGTNAQFSPTSVSEIIVEKFAYNIDTLSKYHSFVTNLKGIKPLPILRQPVLGMGCQTGCNVAGDDVQIRKEEKLFSPKQVGMTITQCFADLLNSNLSFAYNGVNRGNLLENVDFMTMFTELTVEFAMGELMRKAWFDNTAYVGGSVLLTPQANSGGAWINPTEDYFSCIDGLWSQAETLGASVTITQNAGATYALQALPANAAYNYLSALLLASPTALFGDDTVSFYITRSMYQNLWASATAVTNLSAGAVTSTSQISNYNGELYFGGIRVVVVDAWDYVISKFFNDGVKLYNPHRAILASSENIFIGFDLPELQALYDKPSYDAYRDIIFQRFRTTLDAKFGIDEYIVSAF